MSQNTANTFIWYLYGIVIGFSNSSAPNKLSCLVADCKIKLELSNKTVLFHWQCAFSYQSTLSEEILLLPGLGPITQNYINYNYIKKKISITITVIIFQINYNYIMRNQIYSAFVNYVFLRILLNFNNLYTIDKQI